MDNETYEMITVFCYADWVSSESYSRVVDLIKQKSEIAADLINRYGIGQDVITKQSDPHYGEYDYESGNLLADIPASLRKEYREDLEKAYEEICDLADDYASWVVKKWEEFEILLGSQD